MQSLMLYHSYLAHNLHQANISKNLYVANP